MSRSPSPILVPRGRHQRDASEPSILEAFPAPPTHIPSKPPTPLPNTPLTPHQFSFQNPPPSRPPSFPLPAVPGPSRISERDLTLLSSANSRPNSKYSTSSDTRRDSLTSSSSSGPSARTSVVSVPVRRTLSNASSSSRSTRSGPPTKYVNATRPSISFSISEEESGESAVPSGSVEELTRLAISPVPLSDDDFDPATSPPTIHANLTLLRSRHRHHDSISSIDMGDLPAADDDEPVVPLFNAFRAVPRSGHSNDVDGPQKLTITVPRAHHVDLADPIDPLRDCQPRNRDGIRPAASPPLPSGQSTTLASGMLSPTSPLVSTSSVIEPSPSTLIEDMPLNPQQLHREMRAARSKSINHKQSLRTRSRSKSASRPIPTDDPSNHPVPDLPTPSLNKKSSQPPSAFKGPPSAQRSSSPDIDSIISATPRPLRRQPSSFSDLGVNGESSRSTRSSFASLGSRSCKSSNVSSSSAKGLDADLMYVQGTRDGGEGSEEHEEGSDDSSIDLHTPLPHLMVKHGLLSPRSKLLPHVEGGSATPAGVDGRPGSTLSMVTKSGVLKDERDTPQRKERHRDGRLLRGGIGLTTGLGWSDSEDENAPSPLTRRLSSLNLSRRSSASSVRTSHSAYARVGESRHPLSRSYSGEPIYHEILEDEEGVDEWGQRTITKSRTTSSTKRQGPPTTWNGRTSAPGKNGVARISTSSAGSLSVKSKLSPSPNIDSSNTHNQNSDDTIHTPSTASSLSIPLPTTPQDDVLLNGSISRKGARGGEKAFDKDKTLPPLPLQPILKKQSSSGPTKPSRSRAGSVTSTSTSGVPHSSTPTANTPTPNTPNTPSTASTTTPSQSQAQAAALAKVTSPGSVRPLQLPQRIATTAGDRPPVPVPSVLPSFRSSTSSTSFQHNSNGGGGGLQPPKSPALMASRSSPGLSASTSSLTSNLRLSTGGSVMNGISAPTSPVAGTSGLPPPTAMTIRPRPRTGTGMVYRKSNSGSFTPNLAGIGAGPGPGPSAGVGANGAGGSRIRAPMPLATASFASVTMNSGSGSGAGGSVGSVVGKSGTMRSVSSGLAVRRARTPGPRSPSSPSPSSSSIPPPPSSMSATPIGQAF